MEEMDLFVQDIWKCLGIIIQGTCTAVLLNVSYFFYSYSPEIFYPKRTAKTLYENLTKQCELFEIPFLTACPVTEDLNSKYSLVVDALFGFSFKAPVRKEFTEIIDNMLHMCTPCCSIDIPSGTGIHFFLLW